jgi:hypothetical protein
MTEEVHLQNKPTRREYMTLHTFMMFLSKALTTLKALFSTTPLQEQMPPEQLDDFPSTPPTPRRSERQRNLEQLAHARELRLEKLGKEKQEADLERLFWAGAAADVDLDSKAELYVMAMRNLDANWTYKAVTEASGIAFNTLKTYQDIWKSVSEADFRFHVGTKKRGRQLFQPLSLIKMQKLNKDIVRTENAQLVSSRRSSFDNVIRPILVQEAEAAGVCICEILHSVFAALTLMQVKTHSVF